MTKLTLAQIIGEILAAENFKVGKVGGELKKYIDDYTEIEVNLLKDLLKDKKKYPNELDPRTGGNKFGYRGMTFKKDFIEKLKEVKKSNGITEYEVPSNMKITSRSTKGYLSFTVDEEVAQGFGHYSGYIDHKKSPDRVGGYVRVSLDNPNFILHPDYTGELSKDLEYSKESEKETLFIGTSFKPDRIYVVEEEIYKENYADGKVKYTNPNLSTEWEEANRYSEFEEMGKQGWIDIAQKGYTTSYSKIKNVLGNVDLDFEGLEEPKKQRFQDAFKKGTIEMSIAVKFSDNDYDLVAGNTRLSGLVKNGIDPKIWIVDLTDIQENYADGKVKGKSRPGRVKKSGASCNGSVTDLRKKAKNASGEKAKMYHWCANMKGGKK